MLLVLAASGDASVSRLQGVDQTMPRASLRDAVPVPRAYLAPLRKEPIAIDGRLDDPAWRRVAWSDSFVDIEGDIRPVPRLRTRVKMLYDSTSWYIAAQLEEPHLWATIRERDAVIFQDNDFEIFVDPDGDTHRYFELEANALGTPWDLFLPKPYRDGGQAVNAWDIDGLRLEAALDGTLNDPRDRDRGWTVEIAIPWSAFADSGRTAVPPRDGDRWRVNFSRVEWDLDVVGGAYRKRADSTGKGLPEHNWVWSPQGAINMHMPEMWGVVQFGGTRLTPRAADDDARWALRRIYYAQREYRQANGRYAGGVGALGLANLPPGLVVGSSSLDWEASLVRSGIRDRWHIRADGKVWRD
jgi:hypothetical protein